MNSAYACADQAGVNHLLIKLPTFIEPKPCRPDRSQPQAANTVLVPDANTPNPPLLVLLQFVEPPAHGTELLPLVMSLKTQVVSWRCRWFRR